MADNDIQVKLVLDSDLQKQFQAQAAVVKKETSTIEKGMSGLEKSIYGLGLTIGAAFSVKSIIAFGKASIAAYDESIVSATKLSTALGYVSDGLNEQAASLQKTTRFEDDSITSMQALLATYRLTESQIKSITPAILDYAAATGTNLESAADKVGRTITTTTNAMVREGVQMSDSSSKSERLSELTARLNDRFKGQAEAVAKLGAGPLVTLSNQYGDLIENVGKAITSNPIFQNYVAGLSSLVELLKSNTDSENFKVKQLKALGDEATVTEKEITRLNNSIKGLTPDNLIDTEIINSVTKQIEAKKRELIEIQGSIERLNAKPKEKPVEDKILKTGGADSEREKELSAIAKWNDDVTRSRKQYFDNKKKQDDEGIEEDNKYWSMVEANILHTTDVINEASRQQIADREAFIAEAQNEATELASYAQSMGAAMAAGFGKGAEGWKESAKAMLNVGISMLENLLYEAQAASILKGILTAGYSIAPDLIALALGTAALEGARAGVNSFARGGDFITDRKQLIMVGDNPGGRERVQVTPLSSTNYNGPQTSTGNITMGDIIINGNADSGTVTAINKSRERQLKDLRKMLLELSYARQMPSFS